MASLLLCIASAVRASGPSEYLTEFYRLHPTNEELLAGRIIGRFNARNPQELLLSYLHLSGYYAPEHAVLFRELWEPQPSSVRKFTAADLRSALQAEGFNPQFYSTSKYVTRSDVQGGRVLRRSYFYENCLPDAFHTATTTFNARKQRYGSGSVELQRWIEAQIQVFANCGSDDFTVPAEADLSWQALEIQDRQYQIAAAHFYAGRFAEAGERFAAIASDAASPWSELGRYLVARSLAREATVNESAVEENIAAALGLYQNMVDDQAYAATFPSAAGQINFLKARTDPDSVRQDLGRILLETPAVATHQTLYDLIYLLRPFIDNPEPVINAALGNMNASITAGEEFDLWAAVAVSNSNESRSLAFARWQQQRTLPWLLLALAKAQADTDADLLVELLREAEQIDTTSSAHFSSTIQRIRLLDAQGATAEAIALAESTLASGILGLGQRNLLRLQLADLHSDWRLYLQHAALQPLQLPWSNDFVRGLDPQTVNIVSTDDTLFTPETTALLNDYFTPAMLLEALDIPGLGSYLQSRLAVAGWTRAMLSQDTATALQFSPRIRQLLPRLNEALLAFENSTDREFEAAWIVINNPAFSPWLRAGVGRLQSVSMPSQWYQRPAPDFVALPIRSENWWCGQIPGREYGQAESARVLSTDRKFAALPQAQLEEMQALKSLEGTTAAGFFGPYILAHARENLDDPRVPRALQRVVFATRHSCSTGPGEVSQQAFTLLHRHFPDSAEAQQTPYWYQ